MSLYSNRQRRYGDRQNDVVDAFQSLNIRDAHPRPPANNPPPPAAKFRSHIRPHANKPPPPPAELAARVAKLENEVTAKTQAARISELEKELEQERARADKAESELTKMALNISGL